MASNHLKHVARKAGRELIKKKNRGLLTALVAILLIAVLVSAVIVGVLWYLGYIDFSPKPLPSADEPYIETLSGKADGQIDIHFLELGNKYTGDCTYIRVGNVDVLIDAGSRTTSIPVISSFLDEHMQDDLLDYVIVTHAHQDHYAGFATGEKTDSLFDLYQVGAIIDFAKTNQKSDAVMYNNYLRERDEEIATGAVHYTADEIIELGKNVIPLSEHVTMTILDQKFYYEKSAEENNYSVCTLFTQGDANYLFTGDLEEDGEKSLIEKNDLPEVTLYKAGHHGSKTSTSEALMQVIKPKVVTVCCCAGSSEYTDKNENQFPTQTFVDHVAPYTRLVYVTTLCVNYKAEKPEDQFTSMNGTIHVTVRDGEMKITCSNSGKVLMQWDWFIENRTMPNAWK